MESDIVVSVSFVYKSADNMFTGMLLHQVKSSVPVNLSGNITACFNRFFCIMDDLSIFFGYPVFLK